MPTTRRRSPFEILLDTLKEAEYPIPRTKLSMRLSITYPRALCYLKFLEEKGYLDRIDNQKDNRTPFLYKTSNKGQEALKLWKSSRLQELTNFHEWSQGETE